ncbi:hypothetical protein NM208_g1648 [Fusarium decemcellulare]|uniref:Uncharacterized protein n=1 Tax=Fusarium decemcellulare TaxID=57161 RepID=A0ACC1SVB2_9HYPO|nr:hypothetical protein NM208_g1648 [Fusarium decemcellulare]
MKFLQTLLPITFIAGAQACIRILVDETVYDDGSAHSVIQLFDNDDFSCTMDGHPEGRTNGKTATMKCPTHDGLGGTYAVSYWNAADEDGYFGLVSNLPGSGKNYHHRLNIANEELLGRHCEGDGKCGNRARWCLWDADPTNFAANCGLYECGL